MRYDTDERAIVLFPDRARLFRTALPSLPTMLSAIPIVRVWRSRKRGQQIIAVLSGAMLLLWESLYVSTWFHLLFPQPVVVVNDEGIAYHPPMPWFVNFALKIRWQEIATIYPLELRKWMFLAIVPKDVEVFAQQQKLIRPRRLPLLITTSQVDTPFLIPELMIFPLKLHELLAQIEMKYQHEIEANDITIGEERKITFKTGQ